MALTICLLTKFFYRTSILTSAINKAECALLQVRRGTVYENFEVSHDYLTDLLNHSGSED